VLKQILSEFKMVRNMAQNKKIPVLLPGISKTILSSAFEGFHPQIEQYGF
jgi:hypothetical protein